jgi:5-methylcytosine-specific restriction endonuclease McrA
MPDTLADGTALRRAQIDAAWSEHRLLRDRSPHPRRICSAERAAICERQNHRCCYCGHRTNEEAPGSQHRPTVEHIVPVRHGGTNDPANLVMACYRCNQLRGSSLVFSPELVEALRLLMAWRRGGMPAAGGQR